MNGTTAVRTVLATCLLLAPALGSGQSDAETRVLDYIRDHLQPGQPLVVTDLYNNVFTQPDERRALEKLYSAFFRIPLFVAQYQKRYGRPPRLNEIAEQFGLHNAEGADILLRVMESDPRVPRFLSRDPKSGEISKVDVAMIESDDRFGKILAHQLGGWEGKPAPEFTLSRLDGGEINSAALHGEVALLCVWFTGCPPCMKEAPDLVKLFRTFSGQGFQVIGANADELLGLAYDDAVRRDYIKKEAITFPVVRWTRESNQAYGGIAIYPTLFLIDRKGLVTGHWIGYVQPEELRRVISKTLQAK